MVIRDLEALDAYQDEGIKQLYVKDSFNAEDFGYAVVLTTFILIVLLVCFVGIGITSPCCCRGTQVNLLSINYPQKVSSCVLEIPSQAEEDNNYKRNTLIADI